MFAVTVDTGQKAKKSLKMRKKRHPNAASSLIAVVSDGIDGAIIHFLRAGLNFLLGGRLLFHVGKSIVAGTEKFRRIALTARASDALIVDIKPAANVLRELICLIRHMSSLLKNRAEGQAFCIVVVRIKECVRAV